MSPSSAQRTWELENDIVPIDPAQNALYTLPTTAERKALDEAKPWRKDLNHFTQVRISALALIKMVTHARSGGSIEIMGLMVGYVSGKSIIVTDAFRLPVEGTETRVNAGADADEYTVAFGLAAREGGGQAENPVGWYHSHPGYGCWLSGIDVSTERLQQLGNDPFVAVVIDPDRTVSAGKVEIGAFRTYPEGQSPQKNPVTDDNNNYNPNEDFQTIPSAKIEDFGAHANDYYPLEVTHFKSTLDTHLLSLLWNKYWTSTLSQSPLFTNREYVNAQITDHAGKVRETAARYKTGTQLNRRPTELMGTGDKNIKVGRDAALEKVVKGGNKVASEEVAGLLANDVKKKLFWGVVQEARVKAAGQQATAAAAGRVVENGG